ncbi:unnamed protein product, partial [Polarella glacialis]
TMHGSASSSKASHAELLAQRLAALKSYHPWGYVPPEVCKHLEQLDSVDDEVRKHFLDVVGPGASAQRARVLECLDPLVQRIASAQGQQLLHKGVMSLREMSEHIATEASSGGPSADAVREALEGLARSAAQRQAASFALQHYAFARMKAASGLQTFKVPKALEPSQRTLMLPLPLQPEEGSSAVNFLVEGGALVSDASPAVATRSRSVTTATPRNVTPMPRIVTPMPRTVTPMPRNVTPMRTPRGFGSSIQAPAADEEFIGAVAWSYDRSSATPMSADRALYGPQGATSPTCLSGGRMSAHEARPSTANNEPILAVTDSYNFRPADGVLDSRPLTSPEVSPVHRGICLCNLPEGLAMHALPQLVLAGFPCLAAIGALGFPQPPVCVADLCLEDAVHQTV